MTGCGGGSGKDVEVYELTAENIGSSTPTDDRADEEAETAETEGVSADYVGGQLSGVDFSAKWNNPLEELPEPTIALPRKYSGSYKDEFNDSNYIHWADAEKIGIEPLTDTRSHWRGRPLVKIRSCSDFYVEELTHSRPYLVPEAALTLHEIGRRFNDTLRSRGGGDYLIRVTSVLRTPETVARLKRSNRNAVDSSVHQLGTTVDISYARFAAYSSAKPRSMDDLKLILAEVLSAMRSEGKIWVKHERHQPCFHITARGQRRE